MKQPILYEMQLQIPIITLTAVVAHVNPDKCLALGMNEYISKPIDEKSHNNKKMVFYRKNSVLKFDDLAI